MSARLSGTRPIRRPPLDLPDGWRVVESDGPGPFVTRAVLESADGAVVEWSSRSHRKHPELADGLRRVRGRATPMSLAIGGCFAVGAICFALGSFPLFFDHVAATGVAATFFVGSIFFTTAAYLQYREVVGAPRGVGPLARPPSWIGRLVGVAPRRIDWWATSIQLGGTVFFNLSTYAAMRTDFTLEQEQRLIWGPDVLGSICFLVASAMAYAEVCPQLWCWRERTVAWWIGGLNLLGSVAFGLAALGARYLDTTGEPANIALVNLGTFVGAVCFLAGAILLPVEAAGTAPGPPEPADAKRPGRPGSG